MEAPIHRRQTDVMELMMRDHAVLVLDDAMSQITVEFHGPPNSLYQDGVWYVDVQLPDDYPYSRPCVDFLNEIMHPKLWPDVNLDGWSPVYEHCQQHAKPEDAEPEESVDEVPDGESDLDETVDSPDPNKASLERIYRAIFGIMFQQLQLS